MKILQIVPNLDFNSIARSTVELSKTLVLTGHESIVVSSGGLLESRLIKDKGTHITLPIKEKKILALKQVIPLVSIIKEHKPDIIHVRARMPAWLTLLALKAISSKNHPKLVSTVHRLYEPNSYSYSMLQVDHLISISKTIETNLRENFHDFPKTPHSLIYHGVDNKFYPYLYAPSVHWWNNIFAEYPELENKIWITLVGSVIKSKGHQWLIDVIGGLKKDYPNIHAVIIGEPASDNCAYYEEINLRIHALGLAEHFTFTGNRADIKDWLAASNVVVALDTKPRGFGRTILESINMGTPVLAWDQGGVSEILYELFPEGLIVKDDCLALCEKVREFIDNPPRPEKPTSFQNKPTFQKVISVYHELLGLEEITEK